MSEGNVDVLAVLFANAKVIPSSSTAPAAPPAAKPKKAKKLNHSKSIEPTPSASSTKKPAVSFQQFPAQKPRVQRRQTSNSVCEYVGYDEHTANKRKAAGSVSPSSGKYSKGYNNATAYGLRKQKVRIPDAFAASSWSESPMAKHLPMPKAEWIEDAIDKTSPVPFDKSASSTAGSAGSSDSESFSSDSNSSSDMSSTTKTAFEGFSTRLTPMQLMLAARAS